MKEEERTIKFAPLLYFCVMRHTFWFEVQILKENGSVFSDYGNSVPVR